jgi:alpha-1,6-mannosyltransferase
MALTADAGSVKTLHLTNSWHGTSGGIGTFYKALFEAANGAGQRMRLVVPSERTRVEKAGDFGLVYHIESPRAPFNPEYRVLYPTRFLVPHTELRRILNSEQPDLVEVSEKYTLPYLAGLLRTRRLPGVRFRPTTVGLSCERMDENMSAYLSNHACAQRFCNWYMKSIYFPMFDHHITVSEHTAAELIDASRGHKVQRGIWVGPMGVDCDLFARARRSEEVRRHLLAQVPGNSSRMLLLYVGRLAPEKNLRLLLETMRLLDPRAHLLCVAGDGILLESLRAECLAQGLSHVAFLGHVVDREQLASYYASADAFLHPNPREPFGIAPLEAMSAGLALVAPNSGGVVSYANARNAWLVDPTAEAFAGAVREIRQSPERTARRTAQAAATGREFRWAGIAGRYLRLYREIHALTQGRGGQTTLAARTYSTPGDWLGREIA